MSSIARVMVNTKPVIRSSILRVNRNVRTYEVFKKRQQFTRFGMATQCIFGEQKLAVYLQFKGPFGARDVGERFDHMLIILE